MVTYARQRNHVQCNKSPQITHFSFRAQLSFQNFRQEYQERSELFYYKVLVINPKVLFSNSRRNKKIKKWDCLYSNNDISVFQYQISLLNRNPRTANKPWLVSCQGFLRKLSRGFSGRGHISGLYGLYLSFLLFIFLEAHLNWQKISRMVSMITIIRTPLFMTSWSFLFLLHSIFAICNWSSPNVNDFNLLLMAQPECTIYYSISTVHGLVEILNYFP